jgi:hypothetical protein
MINSNFGFTPLKEVWIGDCYPESYYDHLPNDVADPFRQITEWTKEDLNKLQKFLEGKGIIVQRPVFESIDDYINDQEILAKPPITPRDHYLVLENTLYSLHNKLTKDPWRHAMDLYRSRGDDIKIPKDEPVNTVCPPAVVRIGRDLYVDPSSHEHTWGFVCEWMIETSKDYRVHITESGGHADGVFCPVAPGILVSTHYKTDYSLSFPGWEIFKIEDNTQHNFNFPKDWLVNDRSIDNNQAFSQHILNAASGWIGNFKETVYEVNMLVVDEHNVIAMKEYPPLFKWLEDRGINVHLFDFRTRSFWDGGWHCLTLDICREDYKQDLFPDRGENGVYWNLA